MPPVLVKTVERVMRGEEKREILARPADAMPGVDGEASLAVSRVVAEEARTGEGGAGGRAMTMETAIAGTEGGR